MIILWWWLWWDYFREYCLSVFLCFFLTSELDELNGTLLKTSPKLCQGPKIHYKPHQPKAGFGLVIMMMMIKIFIFLVSCTIAEPGCRVNLVPFLNWCLVDIKVFLVTWLTDWGCFWVTLQSCNTCFPCISIFTLPWPPTLHCIVPSQSTSTSTITQ